MWLYKTVRKYFREKLRENISSKGKSSVAKKPVKSQTVITKKNINI